MGLFNKKKSESIFIQQLQSMDQKSLKLLHSIHNEAHKELHRDERERLQEKKLFGIIEQAEREANELNELLLRLEELEKKKDEIFTKHPNLKKESGARVAEVMRELTALDDKIKDERETALGRAKHLEHDVRYIEKLAQRLIKEMSTDLKIDKHIKNWAHKVRTTSEKIEKHLKPKA